MLSRIRIEWPMVFLYSLMTIGICFLHLLVIQHIVLWNIVPFIFPFCAIVVGVFEGHLGGGIYGLCLGLLCDVIMTSSPIPGFFTITFTLLALVSALFCKYRISSRFLCSLIAGFVGYGVMTLLRILILYVQGNAFLPLLLIAAKEWLLSYPWILLVYFLFFLVYRYFNPKARW